MTPMPLPSPPTDNLYKFVALSGVVLAVVGLLFPISEVRRLVRDGAEVNRLVSTAEAESEAHSAGLRRLESRVDRLHKEVVEDAGEELTEESKDKVWQELRDISSRQDVLDEQARSLRRLRAEAKSKLEEVRDDSSSVKFMLALGLVISLSGVCLAYWGFSRWYQRVQRHLDLQLAIESAKLAPVATAPAVPKTSPATTPPDVPESVEQPPSSQ